MGGRMRGDLTVWAIVLVAAVLLVGVLALFGLPALKETVAVLNAGVSLKTAALWSFGVTVVLFIVFAIAAGDGLLGELQYMLGGFFSFFLIITLLIAWIF